ncbi:hypothetical protein BSZ19_49720 [Bradyrhizobium japonicum]|uniref:Uncharacterized protein n=1 Tax=Bradyrhizobium japonicum TaxID=375 RepID=A0A1Y2J873_BRAJP|nr:hypothetical protein BSZ19_49720 [Bradyrhizobium japonicum]
MLGFLWLVVLIDASGLAPRLGNLVLFVASISILPAVCAAIQYWIGRDSRVVINRVLESINVWCTVLVLLALIIISVTTWSQGELSFWQKNALWVAQATLELHLALVVAVLGFTYARPTLLKHIETAVLRYSPSSVQTVAFAYAFAVGFIALFRIAPGNGHFNALFDIFSAPIPGGFPNPLQIAIAALFAILSIMIGASLLIAERQLDERTPGTLLRIRKLALPLTIVGTAFLCFDFSLSAEPFHYMTNVGPALHLMNGGTLMVDTFSQYGPGPVLITYLAFQLGQPSFAVANIAIQFCNILFYILLLIALWHSTPHKLAALWLGLIALTFWLSGWAYNGGWSYADGNVNGAPSVLGARYLPLMLMVVALAIGAQNSRHSVLTFLASFLAAFWSAEAVAGVLALHCGFLTLINWRDRNYRRLVVDLALACLPVAIALMAMTLGIFLTSGKLPAFAIYLGYFASYNPVALFWSKPFEGLFWGWIPFLLAVVVAAGISWLAVIGGRQKGFLYCSDHCLRRCLPAALLTALMSAYFVGRSVDFVILIAFLPLTLLVIPPFLWLANAAASRDRVAMSLLTIPLIALLWMSIFSLLILFRVGSSYSLIVHECRDHGRCTPAALGRGLSEKLRHELALEPEKGVWALNPYDRSVVVDANRLMARFADSNEVTILLGASDYGYHMLSELALMYAGKWHTWPRSFAFSDELVPRLLESILAAPINLRSGNIVILRRNEAEELGSLEAGVLKKILSNGYLCSLEGPSDEVVAYRFYRHDDPLHSSNDCTGLLYKKRSAVASPGKPDEILRDLPTLIRNIQDAAAMLPDGAIDLATLRRANVHVPKLFVRGFRMVTPPWAEASVTKFEKFITLDLFGIDPTACTVMLVEASRIPGVARIATTGASVDERSAPLTDEQAAQACLLNTGFIRLIQDTRP